MMSMAPVILKRSHGKRLKRRPPDGNDYGPHERTDLIREVSEVSGARVSRARVRDGLLAMMNRGHISREQYHAAEFYRDDLDYIAGASMSDGDRVHGIRSSSRTYGPSDLQCDAIDRVRRVRIVVLDALPALGHVVERGGTLEDLATALGCPSRGASQMLQDCLGRLVDFYDNMLWHRR